MRWAAQLTTTAVDLDYAPSVESSEQTVGALMARDAYLPLHQATAPLSPAGNVFDILKPYRAAAFAGFHTKIVED
jgi:hypothetical protein